MARPTILIGIGSGGLRSIEAAWKLSQEVVETERPIVEYIYLDHGMTSLNLTLRTGALDNFDFSQFKTFLTKIRESNYTLNIFEYIDLCNDSISKYKLDIASTCLTSALIAMWQTLLRS